MSKQLISSIISAGYSVGWYASVCVYTCLLELCFPDVRIIDVYKHASRQRIANTVE